MEELEKKKPGRPPKTEVKEENKEATMNLTESQVKALIDDALRNQKEQIIEEVQTRKPEVSADVKKRYRTIKRKWKIYKLLHDVIVDKELKDGSVKKMIKFKEGSLFEQDDIESKMLGRKRPDQMFKIGDPKHFAFVREEVRSSSEAILTMAEY